MSELDQKITFTYKGSDTGSSISEDYIEVAPEHKDNIKDYDFSWIQLPTMKL